MAWEMVDTNQQLSRSGRQPIAVRQNPRLANRASAQHELTFLTPMTDTTPERQALPDHLSIDARSPHHVAAVFEHDVGIRFNGKDRLDVVEYCISEGWVKVPAGKTLDRKGNPLVIKLKGAVEAFYR
ncbi:MAG: hypothetical protein ACI9M6_000646 [Hydrogenophaga sp.]|jgi:hypothetical protein